MDWTKPAFPLRWFSRAMIRGLGNAIVIVLIASLLDEYFYAGRHTDAALAILRQIGHSFGL
jgi:hypothetical protein